MDYDEEAKAKDDLPLLDTKLPVPGVDPNSSILGANSFNNQPLFYSIVRPTIFDCCLMFLSTNGDAER